MSTNQRSHGRSGKPQGRYLARPKGWYPTQRQRKLYPRLPGESETEHYVRLWSMNKHLKG
jgi:hypothetical protein